ncbi:MAG TPA: VOC family protein [Solimonas sp.]|nr:VOC family protein [Solimonas sp.]
MNIEPYLFFEGRCEEALEFYKQAIGAEIGMLMRYKDSPEPPHPDTPAGSENKVMHCSFRIGDSTLMASDGACNGRPGFQGFALSLNLKTGAEADKAFAALSAGGSVTQPLIQTFFSPRFGMLTDKFGMGWMIHVVA